MVYCDGCIRHHVSDAMAVWVLSRREKLESRQSIGCQLSMQIDYCSTKQWNTYSNNVGEICNQCGNSDESLFLFFKNVSSIESHQTDLEALLLPITYVWLA